MNILLRIWASVTMFWCLLLHRDAVSEDESEVYCEACDRTWTSL